MFERYQAAVARERPTEGATQIEQVAVAKAKPVEDKPEQRSVSEIIAQATYAIVAQASAQRGVIDLIRQSAPSDTGTRDRAPPKVDTPSRVNKVA